MQEPSKFCPVCGQQNNLSAQFCQKCGIQYGETAPEPAPEKKAEPASTRLPAVLAAIVVFVLGFIGIDPIGLLSRPEAVVELATGANAGITLANYERLQTGISYAQACEILGKTGTEMSRSEMVGYVTVMYSWQGDGVANMNAMFQNGKLVSKAQFGLK
jgi:hypothetical protein